MDLSNENVIHIKKDNIEYLQFRKLLEYSDILNHAYSLGTNLNFRTAGVNLEPLPPEIFEKNCKDYEKLCKSIGENYKNLIRPNQEHTNTVLTTEKHINPDSPDFNLPEYNKADGLITNKSDLILATTNADCILLLFFDPIKKVIANTHSGWKGTLLRISVTTVKKMINQYGCNPKDIICCICPSIRKCHFEVDREVKDLFEKEFKNLNNIITYNEDKNKWNIDTVLINKIILEEEGLTPNNIIDSGICSVCNSSLIHSFRVEKEGYGLNTALINLK